MAATEDDSIIVELDEEVEGDHRGSDDYCFIGIGEPVPVSGYDPEFDAESPPSQPLAVSERFGGLIFVAHSTGFCVTRTKDVIESAKEIEEKGIGLSIKELSVVDVPIGKVYILALSAGSSTLAASIGGDIHFYSVSSLLNKEQSPSFSCSLNDSSCVKDMRWTKKLENFYVVLSSHGKLYHGASQDPLTYVMDNVDAVEWSVKGDFVAVTRKNILSILSSKFKQKFSMPLSFKSWIGDSDLNCTVKVDSMRWVRPDCIILGCFLLTADGKEENYLVQVITSKDGKVIDASSKPIVLSFSDVFEGIIDDIVPFGTGPYMSLSYLDSCGLAIIANRKSTDQHIVLFGWSLDDDKKEAAVIDILRDTLCPKIALQENGDDNIVLGLCLDKISYNEKVEVKLGAEYKELSPFCVLLCLSFDGRLSMFQVASASGASVPSDVVSLPSDEDDDTPAPASMEDGLSKASSGLTVKSLQQETITGKIASLVNSQTLKTNEQQKLPVSKLNKDTDGQQSLISGQQGTGLGQSSLNTSHLELHGSAVRDFSKTETQKLHEGGCSPDSFSGKCLTDVSSQTIPVTLSKSVDLGKLPGKLGSAGSKGASSESSSNEKLIFPMTSGGSSLLSFSKSGLSLSGAHLPEGSFGNFSGAKEVSGLSIPFYSSGKTGAGITEPLPSIRSSSLPSQQSFMSGKFSKDKLHPNKENYRTASTTRLMNSEPQLSKQFGNVEEMIKELETLLECIERAGGFRDACIVQNSSVLALEEGTRTLFDRCRLWKSIMGEQRGEIQLLLDNTVQVLARKIYMEGIVKQATDGQYWDLWNHQKLSSELELKRRCILKVNQELTNQLIELERHLNTLELNKFGENDGVRMSQRTFPSRYASSRNVQSLHSLHNAMSSQLAAAEQLSECLSKQMAVLSIEAPSVKKPNVRRELFDAIGIPYSSASFSSPDENKTGDTPSGNKLLISSCSNAVKSQSRRNQSSAMRSFESEHARRRRNSLDRSWASFEPPKTTVKRMLLHEDRQKASADRSSLLMDKKHAKSHMLEGLSVAHPEHRTTTSTLLFPSEEKGIRDRISAFSSQSASISSTVGSQNYAKESFNLTGNRSSSGVTIIEKSDSLSVNESKLSKIDLQTPSMSKRIPGRTLTFPKKPNEMSNSNDKDTNFVESTIGSVKHGPRNIESSFFESGKGFESPFSPASVVNPAPSSHAEVIQSDTAASKSHSGRIASSSSTSLFSTLNPSSSPLIHSSFSSSLPNPIAPSSSSAISIGRSSQTSFKVSNASQTASLSQSSVSSYPTLSSGSTFQVPENPLSSPIPIPSMNLKTESTKKEPQPTIPKLSSTTDENSTIQASISTPEPALTLKLESSVPSIGSGQQALGSVLGAFGQSRQLGVVPTGITATTASGFGGGLVSSHSTGGFAGVASGGGGFAGVASAGGGFGAAASAGGGFGGVASAGGGFAGAASGVWIPSSGGGFGAFNGQQGGGGFSAFGNTEAGTGRPPSVLFTQMRK
ncbi:Nuclear pore complex protein NUP214 [Camellia lanceoleosa]|uniref:Nuclear pore complex protein NUP214 n=1 Tax=Camellia lanceoleosa TaxID=1840588 RepID=A0ACC0H6M9_9ERIC|nr:Nuclear pore complex protein NUP214 [Camellia lanceoleosa]